MKTLLRSESAEIGGGNPNCEKIPNMKILPRSESAEIGRGNANCIKIQTIKILHRSKSAEIGGGSSVEENPNYFFFTQKVKFRPLQASDYYAKNLRSLF